MLAPMQGLTNRALRRLFIEWVRPDVVFTEFLQVRPGAREGLSSVDCAEIADHPSSTALVVQLIGRDIDALVAAAKAAQTAGAIHININMGCPYGRMQRSSSGGALLKHPGQLQETLTAVRSVVGGSLSVKLRAGYDSTDEIFALLPLFEQSGIDFLVLHPRTVVQKYAGLADHAVTHRVVERTELPVIANGDINHAADGQRLLQNERLTGLMLGRGAIADPWLFERLRGKRTHDIPDTERSAEIRDYLLALCERYRGLFCGDQQVLYKLKEVTNFIPYEWFQKPRKQMRRTTQLERFIALIEAL